MWMKWESIRNRGAELLTKLGTKGKDAKRFGVSTFKAIDMKMSSWYRKEVKGMNPKHVVLLCLSLPPLLLILFGGGVPWLLEPINVFWGLLTVLGIIAGIVGLGVILYTIWHHGTAPAARTWAWTAGAVFLLFAAGLTWWFWSSATNFLPTAIPSPTAAEVGTLTYRYWFAILLAFALVFAAFAFTGHKDSAGMAIMSALLILFIIVPFVGWLRAPDVVKMSRTVMNTRVQCPDATAAGVRECVAKTTLSERIGSVPGEDISGLRMCSNSGFIVQRDDSDGKAYYRVRVENGEAVFRYLLAPAPCPVL